jgi:hypothetical protein
MLRSRRTWCIVESREDVELSKSLCVGDIPFIASEGEPCALVEQPGTVAQISVIADREIGRACDFA